MTTDLRMKVALIATTAGIAAMPANAATKLFSIGACAPQTNGVCFGMPPAPATARSISVNVPSKGVVMVMVSGSGYCQNAFTEGAEVADFVMQIVEGTEVPRHTGPGGLRIRNVLTNAPSPSLPTMVPFNVSSHRVFTYSGPGEKNFNLRLRTISLGEHVGCYAYSLNMTAVFNSQ